MSKLAIIGGRDFSDRALMDTTIKRHLGFPTDSPFQGKGEWVPLFNEVVSGGARGADKMGAAWVKDYNDHGPRSKTAIKLTEFIPDWDRFGKSAGFRRNEDIVATADMVLCFWDGVSKGTQHSIGLAKKAKKTTLIVYY